MTNVNNRRIRPNASAIRVITLNENFTSASHMPIGDVRSTVNDLAVTINANASREDYINWVEGRWKPSYKRLGNLIRQVKKYRDKRMTNAPELYRDVRQADAEFLRVEANKMLNLRETFKVLAKVSSDRERAA